VDVCEIYSKLTLAHFYRHTATCTLYNIGPKPHSADCLSLLTHRTRWLRNERYTLYTGGRNKLRVIHEGPGVYWLVVAMTVADA